MTTPQYWAVFKGDKQIGHACDGEDSAWINAFQKLFDDSLDWLDTANDLRKQGYYLKPVVVLTVDEYSKKESEIKALREALLRCKNEIRTAVNMGLHGDVMLVIDKALGENSNA